MYSSRHMTSKVSSILSRYSSPSPQHSAVKTVRAASAEPKFLSTPTKQCHPTIRPSHQTRRSIDHSPDEINQVLNDTDSPATEDWEANLEDELGLQREDRTTQFKFNQPPTSTTKNATTKEPTTLHSDIISPASVVSSDEELTIEEQTDTAPAAQPQASSKPRSSDLSLQLRLVQSEDEDLTIEWDSEVEPLTGKQAPATQAQVQTITRPAKSTTQQSRQDEDEMTVEVEFDSERVTPRDSAAATRSTVHIATPLPQQFQSPSYMHTKTTLQPFLLDAQTNKLNSHTSQANTQSVLNDSISDVEEEIDTTPRPAKQHNKQQTNKQHNTQQTRTQITESHDTHSKDQSIQQDKSQLRTVTDSLECKCVECPIHHRSESSQQLTPTETKPTKQTTTHTLTKSVACQSDPVFAYSAPPTFYPYYRSPSLHVIQNLANERQYEEKLQDSNTDTAAENKYFHSNIPWPDSNFPFAHPSILSSISTNLQSLLTHKPLHTTFLSNNHTNTTKTTNNTTQQPQSIDNSATTQQQHERTDANSNQQAFNATTNSAKHAFHSKFDGRANRLASLYPVTAGKTHSQSINDFHKQLQHILTELQQAKQRCQLDRAKPIYSSLLAYQ